LITNDYKELAIEWGQSNNKIIAPFIIAGTVLEVPELKANQVVVIDKAWLPKHN